MTRNPKWTQEEISTLEECYKNMLPANEMAKLFPGRTIKAIQKKAFDNGFQKKYPKFPNIDYSLRHKWTKEDEEFLEEEYSKFTKISDIATKMGLTEEQVSHKAIDMGLTKKYIRKNNASFTAPYQDYDWCYERYINRGMSHEEMAEELGCGLRVIQKWCVEKFGLHSDSFRSLKKLNDLQRQVILAGTFGDGHIDKRPECPIYIESHSEGEFDYLFWKYEILKDLCNLPPIYHQESYSNFGKSGYYKCKPFYRMGTRIIDELAAIRDMPRLDKILQLTELGFCLHMLDDGSRSDAWIVCLAEWTQEEMDAYQRICWNRFGVTCKQEKNQIYYRFDADSSRMIDGMILRNLPNNLDIIHKKILDNNSITSPAHYRFVSLNDGNKIGLANFCRTNNIFSDYEAVRDIYDTIDDSNEISEDILLDCIGRYNSEILQLSQA